jgi:hypothetical protein
VVTYAAIATANPTPSIGDTVITADTGYLWNYGPVTAGSVQFNRASYQYLTTTSSIYYTGPNTSGAATYELWFNCTDTIASVNNIMFNTIVGSQGFISI